MKTTTKLEVAAAVAAGVIGLGFGTVWAATSGAGSRGAQPGTPVYGQQMMGSGANGMMGSGVSGMMGSGANGMMGSGANGMMGSGVNGMMGSGVNGMMGSGMTTMWSTTASLPAPIQGAQQLSVVAGDGTLTPATLTVTAGSAVNIEVRNSDTDVHGFAIPALDIHTTIQPGQSVTFGLKVTTAGSYAFMSMDPGASCLRGVLTVTA